MSAWLKPTCGWLDTVLSIFATRTGWSSAEVLFDGTSRPVSGQNWVIVWPLATGCGSAAGVELDEPPQALSSRLVAVRADRVRATRRTENSIGVGPRVGTSVKDDANLFGLATPWT